jgi:hypothetical protein
VIRAGHDHRSLGYEQCYRLLARLTSSSAVPLSWADGWRLHCSSAPFQRVPPYHVTQPAHNID